jgi:hypothetical protein
MTRDAYYNCMPSFPSFPPIHLFPSLFPLSFNDVSSLNSYSLLSTFLHSPPPSCVFTCSKRPNDTTLRATIPPNIPADSLQPNDVVTFVYAGYNQTTNLPNKAKVYRRRPDLTWQEVLDSHDLQTPHQRSPNGMHTKNTYTFALSKANVSQQTNYEFSK